MDRRTSDQSKRLHAILGKLKIDAEEKREMVYEVTEGRETSSGQLTVAECDRLIQSLQGKQGYKPGMEKYKDDPTDKQRKKILAICREMRWVTSENRVDFIALNTWLLKYGMFHKKLNALSETELPATITQFEQLLKSYYAKR